MTIPAVSNYVVLSEATLGDLALGGDPYAVTQLQIGAPAVRDVMRNRALASGAVDDTAYTGPRAFTLAVMLNDRRCGGQAMQTLIDRLSPYTNPRRRLWLRWSLPGSPGLVRQARVRGEGLPVTVRRPRHNALVCSFVAADNRILSVGDNGSTGEVCEFIEPSGDTEAGRTYSLTFDRTYPASTGIGERFVQVEGNAEAHWKATINAIATDPTLRVNGIDIAFTNGGGLALTAGQTVVIDTLERTVLLNGDPAFPKYNLTNFAAWQWRDLMLQPGTNRLRLSAASLGAGFSATVCWSPTWEA